MSIQEEGTRTTSGGRFASCLVAIVASVGLAWLLLSVFVQPRDRCRKSQCSYNIRECCIAIQLYTQEYDGCLPSSALVPHANKWNQEAFKIFAAKRGELPANGNPRTWVQAVYKYAKAKDIFACPSDPADHEAADSEASYWWKLAADKAWYGEQCKKPCRKLADFVYNSDQVILYEHFGWHYGETDGLKDESQINVAFLDCHVKTASLVCTTSGNRRHCVANSDGQPMYYNYDNDRPYGKGNPAHSPAKYVDPGRYSDRFAY